MKSADWNQQKEIKIPAKLIEMLESRAQQDEMKKGGKLENLPKS